MLLNACAESFDSPSQYSNVGFDKGRRADDATNTIPNLVPASNSVAPGYYSDGNSDFSSQGARATAKQATINSQPTPQQGYYQQAPQGYYAAPQPYYQQVPSGYYVQQPYPAQYPQQVAPASRFYSNPYAIPPSNQAPQYYDSDQYYTAPTYYRSDSPQSSTQQQHHQ